VLNERSQAFANSMDELYNQARQIDQIIELITEVAEETNLLALNATIEAAGAREYGRRFASVANEVQRLANRSRDAADQVRQVMDEFRRAIQNSSEVALQGVNDTDNILSNSRQMEFTLEGIVAMVENTATLARQISLSIQQQRGATVQVVDTMRHISSLSNAVARGSEDLMTSLYDLNTAVTRLNEPETNGSGTLNGR
jgi:methyl-accepting chemotaxis protein